MQQRGILLNDILSIIAAKKLGGILTLENQMHLGTLTFKDGLLIGAQSPYGQKLGDIVVAQGRIDSELLLKTVEMQKREGDKEPLGALFIRMGKVSFDEVKDIVTFQLEDALKIFRKWLNITFSFSPINITPVDSICLKPKKYLANL
ncbi:MAG: hypothetical protein HZC10_02990 [Nitrospirae bacterium]|nr:hypothetical protein [Nitrospirota bacterium]